MLIKWKLFSLLLVLALLLAACAGEEAAPEVSTPTEPALATATQTAENHGHELPQAGATATEVTEAPAQQTVAATAPEPTETQVPAVQRAGLLRFRDGNSARSNSFQLLMDGLAAPPAGFHYELWLTDEDHNVLNLGEFAAGSEVRFDGSARGNLLSRYSGAFISLEQDEKDSAEIGSNAFSGVIPAVALVYIRRLVFEFPENPDGKAFLFGAEEQVLLASEHAGFLQKALVAGKLAEAQRHAEHVVNTLEGEGGERFGDLDGDDLAQNPGDGVGVLGYLEGAKQQAQLGVNAPDATAEVKLHGGHVMLCSRNAQVWLEEAVTEAIRIIASDTAEEALPASAKLNTLTGMILNGQDIDGDGAAAPVENEGGILTAYEHAQNMGSVEFYPVIAAEEMAVIPTSAQVEETAPVETEAPQAVGTVVPATEVVTTQNPANHTPAAAPAGVTIEMEDFAFTPAEITIRAGTTVTWVNKDSVQHSATAENGSFDTGLFSPGERASVTFDQPGAYAYHCILHGDVGGQGMSGTISVTP
jgi:plastocyanin